MPYAQGMAAGPWVFATGHMAQIAIRAGSTPAVEAAGLPHGGLPKNQKEADADLLADRGRAAGGRDRPR